MNTLKLLSRRPIENNREYAYRTLRYNIMTLVLAPGSSINENEASEQLGTSRTPVHEALTLLKTDYLVEILPQSGSFVTRISMSNLRQAVFLRERIETALYRQLAGGISSKYLEQMSDNLKEAEQTILTSTDDSLDRYIKLDDTFHKIAYMAAEKPILWTAVENVSSHFQRIRYQESILIGIDMSHIHLEHKQIYEYLLLGGGSTYDMEGRYMEHLSYFRNYIHQLLEMNPDYYVMD